MPMGCPVSSYATYLSHSTEFTCGHWGICFGPQKQGISKTQPGTKISRLGQAKLKAAIELANFSVSSSLQKCWLSIALLVLSKQHKAKLHVAGCNLDLQISSAFHCASSMVCS